MFKAKQHGQATVVLQFSAAENLRPASLEKYALGMQTPETLADVIPGEDDYIYPEFRGLSAAYLGAGGYHLDFSRPGVLQQSIPLLLKAPDGVRKTPLKLMRDHSYSTGDILGYLQTARWDEGGDQFPHPGINVGLALDWKMNPREARALLSTPPLIDSVSFSLSFNWEKSHEDLSMWQFVEMLGRELDGQIVRLVVTEIVDYDHIALVWEGGDSDAKKIENARKSLRQVEDVSLPAAQLETQRIPKTERSLSMNGLTISNIQQFMAALQTDEIANEEDLLEAVKAMAQANAELRSKLDTLAAAATAGKKYLEELREDTLRLAALVSGEEAPKEPLSDLIKSADLKTLQYLHGDYQARAEKLFPAKCAACGSTEISRRSSAEEPKQDRPEDAAVNEGDFHTGR